MRISDWSSDVCSSDLTATGTYLGKVAVARDAQQTDSAQDVKAMLPDRSATANAKPEPEIFADDVKCAHGCAIGEDRTSVGAGKRVAVRVDSGGRGIIPKKKQRTSQ